MAVLGSSQPKLLFQSHVDIADGLRRVKFRCAVRAMLAS
jgi:hypothetical protein